MVAVDANQARMTFPEYCRFVFAHFQRHWLKYSLPVVVIAVLQLFIRIDVNVTDSLPDKVFITVKGFKTDIKKGDYIAFNYQGEGPASPFPKGFHFVKIVGGVAGDLITKDEKNNFYRGDYAAGNASLLGHAKPVSKRGFNLDAGPTGVIPPGQYYVMTPHADSLDSRYALTGWVKDVDVIGKTFALF